MPATTTFENLRPTPPRVPRATRNVITNWVTYLISGVVSFFLAPFVVRYLGNSAYGVWALLVSLTGYLGFLDLGIRGAVTRYIAKFYAEGEHEQSSRVVSSACGLFIVAGFLAIVLSGLFALLAVPRLEMPPAYRSVAQLVVLIAGLNVAASLVSGIFGGVLVGLQRFDLNNSIALGTMAFRAVAIVIALKGGRGLIALALIQLACTIAELFLGMGLVHKLYPQLNLAINKLRWAYVSVIFSFGLYAFLLHLSNYLVYYTDALVIGAFLPVSAITFFSIASNLTLYARELVSGFSRTMTPLASTLEVETGRAGVREAAIKGARFCSIAVLPIFVTFIIRGHSFINLWMGSSYGELSGHVLWILSIPWFLGAGAVINTSVMLGISRHRAIVPVAVLEGLVNLGLSVALVKPLGIVGVAWGTAIPNLAVSFFFWPWYVRRTLGVPIQEYALSVWLRPTVAVAPFAFCTYMVNRFWPATNLFYFFLQVVVTLPAALAGAWYIGLRREEGRVLARQLLSPIVQILGLENPEERCGAYDE